MSRLLVILCVGALSSGCADALELAIDLRTDYRPGVEMDQVRVTWERTDGQSLGEDTVGAAGHDFVGGARLADVSDLPPGTYRIEVTLLSAGAPVATRVQIVQLTVDLAVTVLMTRSCAAVSCPPSGQSSLTECVGGECVDPGCSPQTPELCPPPSCVTDEDCPAPSAECGSPRCLARRCFDLADDALCTPCGLCDPRVGCVAGPRDAGASDAALCPLSETACTDGLDDDRDGAIDCEDSDCAGATCDDADACTHGDVCGAGVCAGEAITCADEACVTRACNGTDTCDETPVADGTTCTDDGNPCTSDECSAGACAHPARSGSCPDDGNECTTDVCSGTTCSHPAVTNGTGLGGFRRCCGGRAVNVSTDRGNCGACGIGCASGYDCTVYDGHPTCDCGAANSQCSGGVGFLCSTSYFVCACLSDAACPGSSNCIVRDGPDYCSY